MHNDQPLRLTYNQADTIRIDSRLAQQLPYSRSFFHHLFDRKAITIIADSEQGNSDNQSSRAVKKSYKLKQWDHIIISALERFLDGGILEEAPLLDLRILQETDDYVIINKPKGILSHPNSVWDVTQPTVVGALYHHYKGILPSSASFIRAGLVHRLDKETDGIMVIAKTERGMTHFKSLFQQKSAAETIAEKESVPLKKFYQAVCYATPQGDQFLKTIPSIPHIIQSPITPKTPHPITKEGITKILSRSQEEYNGQKCYRIDIEILTGRTHQIRVHCSERGLPIIGDYLYGQEEEWVMMHLTAKKLIFQDLNGSMQSIDI